MNSNLAKAQELIYGKSGLGASNFKMFPGSSRDATPDQVYQELATDLQLLLKGELEEITGY